MAKVVKFTGLIVRESIYGETDKLLDIITHERGLVTVAAKGSRKSTSKSRSASHVMFYGDFGCYERDGRFWLREASAICDFYDVNLGIERLSLISYIFDVARYVTFEGETCEDLLRLLLNVLYVIAQGERENNFVKAVFELRCAAEIGYAPELSNCTRCTKECTDAFYDLENDECICKECADKARLGEKCFYLPAPVREAGEYIVSSPQKRIFAFSIDESVASSLYAFAEAYILDKTEHYFKSLQYYKDMTR